MTRATVQNFSGKTAGYARHRWNYAPEAIDEIARTAQLTLASVVADIGAGTGMLSTHFIEWAGRVLAVEPNAEMRQAAQAALGEHRAFTAVEGSSDATTLPDESVDLIVVGRALHWFPPAATKAEFQRILKPGGWLAVLRIPCAGEELLAALQAIKTAENGWNMELAGIRQQQPPFSFYFGHDEFLRLRFPSVVQESWEDFFGRLCSLASAPSASHPRFSSYQNAARAVFDRFRSGEFLSVPLATEVFLGRCSDSVFQSNVQQFKEK